jgi:hypothetical protein
MKIATTDTDLHELEKITDGAREGSVFVKAPKVALSRILRDHFDLLAQARKAGVVIEAGPDQRSLT